MKKNTKNLLAILIPIGLFVGLLASPWLVGTYYHGQFIEKVEQVQVGMTIDEVKQILPYEYNIHTKRADIDAWVDQEVMKNPAPDEVIQSCHLYMFFSGLDYFYTAADHVYVYIDPKTQTVKHVALLYW